MTNGFPYTQIRIARPADKLDVVVDFNKNGLGLNENGRFEGHDGFSASSVRQLFNT